MKELFIGIFQTGPDTFVCSNGFAERDTAADWVTLQFEEMYGVYPATILVGTEITRFSDSDAPGRGWMVKVEVEAKFGA